MLDENENSKKLSLKGMLISDWPVFILLIGSIVLGLVLYPKLPDPMPIHWNAKGVVDGFAPKNYLQVLMLPLITLGSYIFVTVLPFIDPKKSNYAKFIGSFRLIKLAVFIFMTLIYIATLMAGMGYKFNMSAIATLGIGLLYIVLGNTFSRVRFNYFVGFRTPWTLSSEEVWRRTHRFGGYIWVVAGILTVLGGLFAGTNSFIVMIIATLFAALVPTVYSFLIHRKLNKEE